VKTLLGFCAAFFIGCFPSGEAAPPNVVSSAGDTCSSQRFATVAAGDALQHLRAARVYAETGERRTALAELEVLLVDLIDSEPDSVFRVAAWSLADEGSLVLAAERDRWQIDARAAGAPTRELGETFLRHRLDEAHRHLLGETVKLLDPRAPRRCGADRWRTVHARALRAQAQ
jgi:hypothetical protein